MSQNSTRTKTSDYAYVKKWERDPERDTSAADPVLDAARTPYYKTTTLAGSYSGGYPINTLQIRNSSGPGLQAGYSVSATSFGQKGDRADRVFTAYQPYAAYIARKPFEDADTVLERIQKASSDVMVNQRNKTQSFFRHNFDNQHVSQRLSEKQQIVQTL